MEFTIERAKTCAHLHNELLALTAKMLPNSSTSIQGGLLQAVLETLPEYFENGQNHPLYRMFELMNWYPPVNDVPDPVLAPFASQTSMGLIKPNVLEDETDPAIVIYYNMVGYIRDKDEMLFDLSTGLAHWHSMPDRWIGREYWVPLETVLRSWMALWKSKKVDYVNSQYRIALWIPGDVDRSIGAWEGLLTAIDGSIGGQSPRMEPMDIGTLSQHPISDFSIEFLKCARRPSFKYIAPGISTFSPDSFLALYSAEPPAQSSRPPYMPWGTEITEAVRRSTILYDISEPWGKTHPYLPISRDSARPH